MTCHQKSCPGSTPCQPHPHDLMSGVLQVVIGTCRGSVEASGAGCAPAPHPHPQHELEETAESSWPDPLDQAHNAAWSHGGRQHAQALVLEPYLPLSSQQPMAVGLEL